MNQNNYKKQTIYKRRRRRRVASIGAVILLSSFAAWASGALQQDPLEGTPLRIVNQQLHLEDFRPDFSKPQQGPYESRFKNGIRARYTIQPKVQVAVQDFLERYKVPYGAFVAINPKTGKILAFGDYSSREPGRVDLALKASYPAASLFKMVTAAAAIEEKGVSPERQFSYRGNINRLKPAHWKGNPKRDLLTTSFSEAFAKSNNVVFAKVAYQWLDRPILENYGERFAFNQQIPFEYPLQSSSMTLAPGEGVLERTAAGFGEVYVSPLHAALMGSAIANDGVMMRPCLVDTLVDQEGKELYACEAKPLLQVIETQTAQVLRDMMGETVRKGTVKKIFRRRARARQIRNIKIGGKTGSLRGQNPKGRYSWFVGMAPLDDPEIVVATMVVNDPVWHIVSAQVAKVAFSAYFGEGLTK